MDLSIKEAAAKRFHCDSHGHLCTSPETLSSHLPCEYICKIWTLEPGRFILNPIHQVRGLNIWYVHLRCLRDMIFTLRNPLGAPASLPHDVAGAILQIIRICQNRNWRRH